LEIKNLFLKFIGTYRNNLYPWNNVLYTFKNIILYEIDSVLKWVKNLKKVFFIITYLSLYFVFILTPSSVLADSNDNIYIPCDADFTKKLDLMVNCSLHGKDERRYYLKIINRNNEAIDIRDINLAIKLWLYEPELWCITLTGQNGEVYDGNGNRINAMQIESNNFCSFVSKEIFIEDKNHKSNQEGSSFIIYKSGVATIPAGGWVQGFEIFITSKCNFLKPAENRQKIYYAYLPDNMKNKEQTVIPGGMYEASGRIILASNNGYVKWRDDDKETCYGIFDDYSGIPSNQGKSNGNIMGPYYDDHHFALYSGSSLIGEIKKYGKIDPETGLPPGAALCMPAITHTPAFTITATCTITPTLTATLTENVFNCPPKKHRWHPCGLVCEAVTRNCEEDDDDDDCDDDGCRDDDCFSAGSDCKSVRL